MQEFSNRPSAFSKSIDRLVRELKSQGIQDQSVLNAIATVPRGVFVPKSIQKLSYENNALPLANGQTISQPYIVAAMTEALELTGNEKILEIGTGSGYQTAILSVLAKSIVSIETIPELAEYANGKLDQLNVENIKLVTGDGTLGYEEYAPYDGIIVTAAAPKLPEAYLKQTNIGGRIVIPIGNRDHQTLYCFTKKTQDKLEQRVICGCRFVPLVGKDGWNET